MIGACRFESKIIFLKRTALATRSHKVLYLVRFYLAYMLMIFFHVNCFLVQYADDTQFLHSNTIDKLDHLIKITEAILVKCRRYFLRNCLMFNSSKAQCNFYR